MTNYFAPIVWTNNHLKLLDQRLLPHEEKFEDILTLEGCHRAIREMVVRGAPCIGFTAIFGLALWVQQKKNFNKTDFRAACDYLISARPTAVNLSFEVNRCFELLLDKIGAGVTWESMYSSLVDFGNEQINLSQLKNTKMAEIGFAELSKTIKHDKWRLMTHCNTGFLACGSLGTALGVISYAHHKGRVEHVYADETRPYLQGSRLTAFELRKENIPYSLVVEGAASYLFSNKLVDAVFVGADRIAANGDTANKVGTSTLAIVASYYQVPFYVVAPLSSFDLGLNDGRGIEIELRPDNEITEYKGQLIAPLGSRTMNPSFDVTDARHITGIICEKGFINPAIPGNLQNVVNS